MIGRTYSGRNPSQASEPSARFAGVSTDPQAMHSSGAVCLNFLMAEVFLFSSSEPGVLGPCQVRRNQARYFALVFRTFANFTKLGLALWSTNRMVPSEILISRSKRSFVAKVTAA